MIVNPNSTQKLVQQRFKQLQSSKTRVSEEENGSVLDKLQDTRFLKFKGLKSNQDGESGTETDSYRKQAEPIRSKPPITASTHQASSVLANYGPRGDEGMQNRRLVGNASASQLLKIPHHLDTTDHQRQNNLGESKGARRQSIGGEGTGGLSGRQYSATCAQTDQNRINDPNYVQQMSLLTSTLQQYPRKGGNHELMNIREAEKSPRSALIKTSSKLSFGGAIGPSAGKRDELGLGSFLVNKQTKLHGSNSKQPLNQKQQVQNASATKEGLIKNRQNSFVTYKNHQNERAQGAQPSQNSLQGTGPYFEDTVNIRSNADNPKILIQQPDSSQDMSLISGITASAANAYNLSQTMASEAYHLKGDAKTSMGKQQYGKQAQQLAQQPVGQQSSTHSNSQMSKARNQKPNKVPLQDRQQPEVSQNGDSHSRKPGNVRSFITANSNSRLFSQFESALAGEKTSTQSASFCESTAVPIRRSTTSGYLQQRRASSSRGNSGQRKSKSRSKSRSKSGTSYVKDRVNKQLQKHLHTCEVSSARNVQRVGQHLDQSEQGFTRIENSKVKSNTEIFQEMLLKTSQIQKDVLEKLQEHNDTVKQHFSKYSNSQTTDLTDLHSRLLIDLTQYPLIPKKSRSFKEIAQAQINQFTFLLQQNLIKGPQLPPNECTFDSNPAPLAPATHPAEATSDQIVNLKFNQQSREQLSSHGAGRDRGSRGPDQKIISLSYLKEIKDRENDIDLYRNQIQQLMDQNNQLRADLSEMTKKHEMDRQILQLEIGKDQVEMEKNIEKICNELKSDGQLFQNLRQVISQIKYDHSERINQLNDQIEQVTNRKNQELQKYVQEVRVCQNEIKKLNQDRENRRRLSTCTSDALRKQYENQPLTATFTQFENKNQPELKAELEYFIEKTQSLEAELKTLNLELLYHRTDKDDIGRIREQMDEALNQVRQMKNQNADLQKQKQHFEKEYLIQKAQLEKQEKRMAQVLQNHSTTRPIDRHLHAPSNNFSDNDESPPAPRNYGAQPTRTTLTTTDAAYMRHISKSGERAPETDDKSRSRGRSAAMGAKSRERKNLFKVHDSIRFNANSGASLNLNSAVDKQKSMQSQAAMIEKLLVKIKKLESMKLKQDFPGIFNMEKNDEKARTYGSDLELKTYKEHINELYELLLKQNGNKISHTMRQDHQEQFMQIKSYLNLQAQMGTLKKFRFDQSFSDLLDLSDLQDIHDTFFNRKEKRIELGELSNMNSKSLYLNAEQQLNIKNDCFEKLYAKISENIGQFFLIYSQMQFQKDKNSTLQDQIKSLKLSREEQLNDICSISPEQMHGQSFYKIRSMLEQERTACKTLELENQRYVEQLQEITQQLEFHKQFNEIDPKVAQHVSQFIMDHEKGDDAGKLRKTGSMSISNKKSLYLNKPLASKKNRSLSRKQKKSQSKVFGGKKSWLKRDDQDELLLDLDLNEAIDKIENLQKQLEEFEQENQLLETDNKTYKHELQQLEQAMQAEAVTRQELESSNMTLQSEHTSFKNELEVCKQRLEEANKKVERLSALNQELRELIEEEREANIDEVHRLEKDNQLKVKQIETRTVILKNKLTHLASQQKVYIQQTFTHEQIVDAILDHMGVSFSNKNNTVANHARLPGSRNGSCYRHESYSNNNGGAGTLSQSDLFQQQRLGMHSSLSEVQKTEQQKPRKRKIKIDYRKKEIQEEFVNNSDYEEHAATSNYRANVPRTLSRNMEAQSQKQLSSYDCVMNGDGGAKSRNRVQDLHSRASQDRLSTHNNKRRNQTGQAYKTIDPSDTLSHNQTPYPDCDLPSQIHKRGGMNGGGTGPPTQSRASQMRRRDQLRTNELPDWPEYEKDQQQRHQKSDSFEQKMKDQEHGKLNGQDEAFEIRSKSKKRLDQIFSKYNQDVQNMAQNVQQPLQDPSNQSTAQFDTNTDPVESNVLINAEFERQAALNEEDYQIKVFRPKHSRSRSRQRNKSQMSHQRSLSRQNAYALACTSSQAAPIVDDQDQKSLCSSTNSMKFDVRPTQKINYKQQEVPQHDLLQNKKSLSIMSRKDSYQAFDQTRQPTSFLAPTPGSTTATANPSRSFAITQKIPKASVYDLELAPCHLETNEQSILPKNSTIQDPNQSLSVQIKEDIKRNLAVQNQFCKEREEFSNKLQALRDRMNQESFSQKSRGASPTRRSSATKNHNLESDSASKTEIFKANYRY